MRRSQGYPQLQGAVLHKLSTVWKSSDDLWITLGDQHSASFRELWSKCYPSRLIQPPSKTLAPTCACSCEVWTSTMITAASNTAVPVAVGMTFCGFLNQAITARGCGA